MAYKYFYTRRMQWLHHCSKPEAGEREFVREKKEKEGEVHNIKLKGAVISLSH